MQKWLIKMVLSKVLALLIDTLAELASRTNNEIDDKILAVIKENIEIIEVGIVGKL